MNHFGRLLCGELDGPAAAVVFVQGANPAVMCPDQPRVLRGLAREDLFTVVHDQVLTDTARYADVVLPATTHFEADDLAVSYGSYTLQRMTPIIPRAGTSRTNDEVSAALAERLGYPADRFDADPQPLLDAVMLDGPPPGPDAPARTLRRAGTTVQFRDTFPSWPSRRARLHVPDSELPLPRYAPLTSSYPLALVSPANHRTINSIFGDTLPAPAVLSLHPDDAAARGVQDGQAVRVWNDQGALHVPCRLDRTLRPGVCSIPKGLWLRDVGGGNANRLTPDTISDLAGGACFNDARVEVALAEGVAPDNPSIEGAST
jgi:anaerobic selenocysteine-containing dehydrogenase